MLEFLYLLRILNGIGSHLFRLLVRPFLLAFFDLDDLLDRSLDGLRYLPHVLCSKEVKQGNGSLVNYCSLYQFQGITVHFQGRKPHEAQKSGQFSEGVVFDIQKVQSRFVIDLITQFL